MSENADPATMTKHADQVAGEVRRRSRWYPAWVAVFGLVTVALVTALPTVARGWVAIPFAVLLIAWIYLMQRWKNRQTVRPVADKHVIARVLTPWLVLYLLATLVGPHVLGHHLGVWALAGIVVALPAFVESARYLRRPS